MKKIILIFFGILVLILVLCSGLDIYCGLWKVIDVKGEKFELFFNVKDFIVRNSFGKKEKFEYS